MTFTWQTQSVPIEGNTPEQNEDAAATAAACAVVCDGASEGWGSGAWARRLANAVAASPLNPQNYEDVLAKIRSEAAPVETLATSWYAEEKQALGAFCTLLQLSFSTAKDGGVKYKAVAVGDTELIHRRGGQIITTFPLESAAEFGNRPKLIGSLAASGLPEPEWSAGRAEPGDVFYLMTDALAEWFLKALPKGEDSWASLDGVTSAVDAAAAFALWVQSLRQSKRMKNDDVTLIRVCVL